MGNQNTQTVQKITYEKLFLRPSLFDYVPFENNILDEPESSSHLIIMQPYQSLPVSIDMLQQFQRNVLSTNVEILQKQQYIYFRGTHPESMQKQIGYRRFFETRDHLNVYLANIMKVKDLDMVRLYSEMNEGIFEEFYYSESVLTYEGEPLNRDDLDLQKKLQLLASCVKLLSKVSYIEIDPENIMVENGEMFVTNFEPMNFDNRVRNLLAIAVWLFSPSRISYASTNIVTEESMLQLLQQEYEMPTVIKEIFNNELNPGLNSKMIALEGLISKYWTTNYKMDSFHACMRFRPDDVINDARSWIFYKNSNKVFFFNVADKHSHVCSLLRKRRKIMAGEVDVVYNQENCELIMIKRGTKHLIKANEFQLENHRSISDITIYQKLPVNFDNPRLFKMGEDIYMAEKHLYKLCTGKPKVLREVAKQIGRDLCIIPHHSKNEVYVILQSKDFYKDGIKIWTREGEMTIFLAGTEAALAQMSQVQAHLDEVDFCLEVFFNVYLMMACNNLYVLDLNYRCFFSYASLSQIQKYDQNKLLFPNKYTYKFEILGQNFVVKFPKRQHSNHCCIKNGKLHIIGLRGQEVLCLVYAFKPTTGSLVLQRFQSLMYTGESFFKPLSLRPGRKEQNSFHKFLVDSEDLFIYKYEKWRFQSELFLKFINLTITPNRNSYDFMVEAEPTIRSLKQEMNILNSNGAYFSRKEILLLIHRIIELYVEILNKQMTHRNMSLSSIYFTEDRQLKLKSWTEPARVEYISDYKDFFLLLFNIISNNQYEKLTAQILDQNSSKFTDLQDLYKMIAKNLKMPVSHEKVDDIERNLNVIKEIIERELVKNLTGVVANEYMFNPMGGTNNLYAVNVYDHKLIRLDTFQEDDEFMLEQDYNYIWNSEFSVLYIMTESRFHSIKIEFQANKDKSDFKVKVEDEEFLPKRIKNSTICLLQKTNLIYSFGGLEISSDEKTTITNYIAAFNNMKLSWEEKGALCYTLVGASALASSDEKLIYLFGGTSSEVNLESEELKIFVYSVESNTSLLKIDVNKVSPYTNCFGPPPIVLPFTNNGDPVYVFYDRLKQYHRVRIMELKSGGIDLSFTIEEEENEQSFNKDGRPKKSVGKPNNQRINFSCKDKSIYYLDNNNNMFFAVFKNISQPYLEITEMMKSI